MFFFEHRKLKNQVQTAVHGLLYAEARCAAVDAHPALVTVGTERHLAGAVTVSPVRAVVETLGRPAALPHPVGVTRADTCSHTARGRETRRYTDIPWREVMFNY